MTSPELTVVMPVYNEEESIVRVVNEWSEELRRIGIDYEIRVYDDGSRDGTAAALGALSAANPRIVAKTHPNCGHGPTIMRGYREAQGDWVFQTDSDGEMPAAWFGQLWQAREGYDLLVGRRAGRRLSGARVLLTYGSRAIIALAFGRGIRDVNAPYRLMRAAWLRERVLPALPADAAVPNIAISGMAARTGARIRETDVTYSPRQAGRSSINLRRAARLAWRGTLDTIRVMRAARR